ncbi:EAL domain-containing protein [Photobacterium lutimaris]|uniref:EAL domain-containing protein n=1 Tax=Photobacterium lutimaris TaxID=388278 RepID=A0A2T3J3T0_9GAMM|nr:EAL domain-containing protein [Photobacterium lutimaris]PSU35903.1 hypothetical protein C9I99_02465 [Photobacterium lutimaris]TDR78978.1 EAL domain-containing protein (putative c-di-GMP-specific phosphodiesterase class I) [Photobacterium lutimaris]
MDTVLRTKDEIERHLSFQEGAQHTAIYQDFVLKSAFQPIVKANGHIFAHEALMRVYNSEGRLVNNGELFNYYRENPIHLINIDRLARVIHLRNFSRCRLSTNLFINMMPITILFCDNEGLVDSVLLPRIYELGLKPEQIYIEILEHYTDDDIALTNAIRHLNQAGLKVVIDDFGVDGSSEQRARAVSPDIIKADTSLLEQYLQGETQPLLDVFSLCQELEAKLIIEGVENVSGYHAATSLGADYLQGYYVGVPQHTKTRNVKDQPFLYIAERRTD